MLTRILIIVFAIGGLALAGLVGARALRATDRRRKIAGSTLSVALAVIVLAGVYWVPRALSPYQLARPAPVDDALTVYFSGSDCNSLAFIFSPCEGENPLYALRARDGTVRWRHPTPGPTYFEWSVPILHDGVLYVTSNATSNGAHAESDGIVAAIRASDGVELWRVQRPDIGTLQMSGDNLFLVTARQVSGLQVSGLQVTTEVDPLRLSDGAQVGSVLLGTGDGALRLAGDTAYRCQSDGALVALRLSDGQQIWRTVVDPTVSKTPEPPSCAATVVDGVIYVQTRASGSVYQPTDSSIVAVRASDGQVLWRYHTGGSAPLSVSGGRIFTVMYGATSLNQYGAPQPIAPDHVIALRASDGSLVWQRSLGIIERKTGQILATSDAVYVGLLGSLLALRAADGALLWQHQGGSNRDFSTPAALDNVVFVTSDPAGSGSASENGFPRPYLLSLRPEDGTQYWQTAVVLLGSLVVSTP